MQLLGRFFIGTALLGFLSAAHLPLNQSVEAAAGGQSALVLHPSTTGLTGDLLLVKLLEHNRQREARLGQYSVPRTYRVQNDKGKVRAEAQVVLHYRAPGTKEFKIVAEKGAGLIHSRVFKPLMESEVETAAGRNRHNSAISPDNYHFNLLGEEDVNGYHCFVVQAIPKRNDTYLFRGKIWIHATEFAVVQIAGQPAKNPSFWVNRVDFVRRYQKLGEFWLPLKDESVTQVRVAGKNILTIDYAHYEIARVGGAVPLAGTATAKSQKR
ncbi:MAG TPA: hypothetical protein VFZ34_30580 [Blastocatellia bacterium]|nr:hypothetical protein [Blastocatellia bacterium]